MDMLRQYSAEVRRLAGEGLFQEAIDRANDGLRISEEIEESDESDIDHSVDHLCSLFHYQKFRCLQMQRKIFEAIEELISALLRETPVEIDLFNIASEEFLHFSQMCSNPRNFTVYIAEIQRFVNRRNKQMKQLLAGRRSVFAASLIVFAWNTCTRLLWKEYPNRYANEIVDNILVSTDILLVTYVESLDSTENVQFVSYLQQCLMVAAHFRDEVEGHGCYNDVRFFRIASKIELERSKLPVLNLSSQTQAIERGISYAKDGLRRFPEDPVILQNLSELEAANEKQNNKKKSDDQSASSNSSRETSVSAEAENNEWLGDIINQNKKSLLQGQKRAEKERQKHQAKKEKEKKKASHKSVNRKRNDSVRSSVETEDSNSVSGDSQAAGNQVEDKQRPQDTRNPVQGVNDTIQKPQGARNLVEGAKNCVQKPQAARNLVQSSNNPAQNARNHIGKDLGSVQGVRNQAAKDGGRQSDRNNNTSQHNGQTKVDTKNQKKKQAPVKLTFMVNDSETGTTRKCDASGNILSDEEVEIEEPEKRIPAPSNAAMEAYENLMIKYNVRLSCETCCEGIGLFDCEGCLKDRLMVQKIGDHEWFEIRPRPKSSQKRSIEEMEICESYMRTEQCIERRGCPFPHSNVEKDLWVNCFSEKKLTVDRFMQDLKKSTLLMRCVVENICKKHSGKFVFICGSCVKKGHPPEFKRKHQPTCSYKHRFNDNRCIAFQNWENMNSVNTEVMILPTISGLNQEFSDDAKEIYAALKDLLQSKFTEMQILDESKRFTQTVMAKMKKDKKIERAPRFAKDANNGSNRVRNSSSCSSAQGSIVMDNDLVKKILGEDDEDPNYDTNLDDLMTVYDSDEEREESQFDNYDEEYMAPMDDSYYTVMSKTEAWELRITDPYKYRRGILKLDGPFNAKCALIDDLDLFPETKSNFPNLREIEIRSRTNCGPAFDGDEVMIELKKTKELDQDTHVYRGTVIAILAEKTDRKSYTFLCRVDAFHAHLMKPINGKAPKLHCVKSVIKKNYPERRDELVAVYDMEADGLRLTKIMKLDPKKRRDTLFVVKYLRWETDKMYPLGYITKVFMAGRSLTESQTVLNILHQVPTKPNEACAEAAEKFSTDNLNLTNRKDFRDLFVITVDPSTCKDMDDAVSLKRLSSRVFELGVHIADVSHYIKKNDVIDKNARRRGTSYYPATDTVYHMLPKKLSEEICSLSEGEDRLTVSVYWKINIAELKIEEPEITKSIIKSRRKLSYEEVQDILNTHDGGLNWTDNDVTSTVVYLNCLAQKLRVRRQNAGIHFYELDDSHPFEDESSYDAHRMIEELMLLTNESVAKYLYARFPDLVPFRSQDPPLQDDVRAWYGKGKDIAESSFYCAQFRDFIDNKCSSVKDVQVEEDYRLIQNRNRSDFGLQFGFEPAFEDSSPAPSSSTSDCTDENTEKDDAGTETNKKSDESAPSLRVLRNTLEDLKSAADAYDIQKAKQIVGKETMHPDHNILINNWYAIQNPAHFIRGSESHKHFSLKAAHYVQFTSPIRRYLDLIIHRFVVAAINNEEAPYTAEEISYIGTRINQLSVRGYSKACNLLKVTWQLKDAAYLPCIVKDYDQDGFSFNAPHLRGLKMRTRTIKYSNLSVSDRPDIDDTKVNLKWEKQLFDAATKPNKRSKNNKNKKNRQDTQEEEGSTNPYARTVKNCKEVVCLNSEQHIFRVPIKLWHDLQTSIVKNCPGDLQDSIQEIYDQAIIEKLTSKGKVEVTSEMRAGHTMIKRHVTFSQTWERGTVLAAQFGAESYMGYLQPVLRLINLTAEKDLCIEHRNDPIKCFADLATDKIRDSYATIELYKNIWLPILAMEAASKAVTSGDSIICNNVDVIMKRTNKTYHGEIKLLRTFIKERKIELFNNSKEGEADVNDYMCIQYRHSTTSGSINKNFIRNVWVGHAIALRVGLENELYVSLEFKVKSNNSDPPESLINQGKPVKCTVEFLAKSLPDRRMEDAVKGLHDSSDLCQRIVLGQKVDSGKIVFPFSDTYDIEMSQQNRENYNIHKNNIHQTQAIRSALKEKFTLIQGPPGTGKTVTGMKLAYWYVKMNRESGCGRRQVLYCGPSNSSVDVVAKWLTKLQKVLGKDCPSFVRVYSESLEKQVYPIPRDGPRINNGKGRRYELIDKDEFNDITLHHIIRQKEKQFSQRIRYYDRLFREENPEDISDEQIEAYEKLVTDAAIDELRNYEIILCTCAASVGPRMTRSLNIHQIIVDECGMCMEPESLIPIAAYKSTQHVTLIGDHRQLQPIVMNTVARNLGLQVSLFERYQEKAHMLQDQYRMHPKICEFPSREFYDSMLVTAKEPDPLGYLLTIWPNIRFPMVFCHVEGAEKILSVTTEDGNEQSRSNDAEREEAGRIFLHLVNYKNVPQDTICILTQYNAQRAAIEQDLKAKGFEHPNVNTIVASQGDEWDFVVITLVRSMPEYEIEKNPSTGWCQRNMGFIIDEHQINVALTRARKGLVILGNKHLLKCDEMWSHLLKHFEKNGLVMDSSDFLPSDNRIEAQRLREMRRVARERRQQRFEQEQLRRQRAWNNTIFTLNQQAWSPRLQIKSKNRLKIKNAKCINKLIKCIGSFLSKPSI